MATQSKLAKLEFLIGVSDKASSKLGRIQKQIENMTERTKQSFTNVGIGAAGMVAAGYSMKQMVEPAIQMQRALNTVSSLGTGADALGILESKAKDFTKSYGGSAIDVVNASYDIQSAIAGLKGGELATFTVASATLAKATKSDAAVITDYVGTMYGIFKDEADFDKIGWAENLAGKTAWAVKSFKTDGSKMAAAWSALGSMGTGRGIGMDEQFAILGRLQDTLPGAQAGTAYKAFLRGVGKAQDALGLDFVDSNGKMLSAVAILEKIKGKYGDLDEAEMGLISTGFGGDEAMRVILDLYNKTDDITRSTEALSDIKGMGLAEDMAATMTDTWQRFAGIMEVAKISFGSHMLPELEKGLDALSSLISFLDDLMGKYPPLTKYAGIFTLVIIGASGAMGLLAVVTGVSQLAFTGIAGPIKLFTKLMRFLRAVTVSQTAVQWAMNAAMYANPIGLVVLAVVGLVSAVAALTYYWDDLTAYLGNTSWGSKILAFLDFFGISFATAGDAVLSVLKIAFFPIYALFIGLSTAWDYLSGQFANVGWTDILMGALKALSGPLGLLLDGASYLAGLAGIEIPNIGPSLFGGGATSSALAPTPGPVAAPASLRASSTSTVPKGGLFSRMRAVSNQSAANQSRTVNVENINIEKPTDIEPVLEALSLRAG